MSNVIKSYKILGCPCLPFDSEADLSAELLRLVNLGEGGYSVAINSEKIMAFNRRSDVRKAVEHASLRYPDSAGAVFGFKVLYNIKTSKMNLPVYSLKVAAREKWPVFLLGTTEEANAQACKNVQEQYPGIIIAGRANGFMSDEEKIAQIKQAKPKLMLVGMGTPTQENFVQNLAKENLGVFSICCGGALNVMAGKIKRAPVFFQNNKMEWLYLLCKEPSRWKRQKVLPIYMVKVLFAALKSKFFLGQPIPPRAD